MLSLMCGSLFHFCDNPHTHNYLFPANMYTTDYQKTKKRTKQSRCISIKNLCTSYTFYRKMSSLYQTHFVMQIKSNMPSGWGNLTKTNTTEHWTVYNKRLNGSEVQEEQQCWSMDLARVGNEHQRSGVNRITLFIASPQT